MRLRTGILITAAWLLAPLPECLGATVSSPPEAPRPTAEQRLVAAKADIMAADYRADLEGLKRLRAAVVLLADDPAWGYLARYWAGFASWRLATNGASRGMSPADLRANLETAAADFEASIRLRDTFADGYAAAAGVNGWLAQFLGGNSAALKERSGRYQQLLARARELEPENPRVLWIEAVRYLFVPVESGGDPARAVALYRRMVEVAGPSVASSPLPDWGKAEGLMSLAYVHANQLPDLAAAEREARAALDLRPDWSFVKDFLLPQIEKRARAVPAAGTPAHP